MKENKISVLVVDDEVSIRIIVERILLRYDYNVITEAHPDVALKRVSSGLSIDLVISDLSMVGMSGLDLAEKLRKNKFPGDILLLTGAGLPDEVVEELKKRGVIQDMLLKPFTPQILLAAVKSALGEE